MDSTQRKIRIVTALIIVSLVVTLLVLGAMAIFRVYSRHKQNGYSNTKEVYYGASYFTDGTYLEFRNGDLFQEFLEEFAPAENYSVTNFLYIDNNPNYDPSNGSIKHDVFVLEISCSEQEYFQAKAQASTGSNPNPVAYDDFIIIHPPLTISQAYSEIGFHEATYTIRYVLITNVGHLDIIWDYDLNWIAGESLLTYTLDPDDPKNHIR